MLNQQLLSKRINKFLDYMTTKNVSEKTIEAYGNDIHMFIGYIREFKNNKEIPENIEWSKLNLNRISDSFYEEITLDNIYSFISYMNLRGNASTTKNRRIMSIKAFYNYLIKFKIVSENLAENIESIKVEYREKGYLKESEMKLLLDVVKNSNTRFVLRDKLILLILLNTGLRNSELRSINLSDINWETQMLTVIGKGNKMRKLYLNDNIISTIKEWLKKREDISIKECFKDRLFLSQQGKELNISSLEKLVKKYLDMAGFDTEVLHVHSLRHSALTQIFKKTKDIKKVQKISGHSSITTLLNIYTHVSDEDIQEAMSNLGIG